MGEFKVWKLLKEEFGFNDPAVLAEFIKTLLRHKETLLPKLGIWKGHLCEAAHHERLKEMAALEEVVKHPNGQKEAPDHKFESNGSLYWLEDKNCKRTLTKKAAKMGCVDLANYKHSYRRSGLPVSELYYKMPDESAPGCKKHILAVGLYPQTKRFEWRYCFYRDLPLHPDHPGYVASALKIPVCPDEDSEWCTSIEELLKRESQ